MKQINKSNAYVKEFATSLYKFSSENKSQFWRRVADYMLKPTRQRRIVNLFKLNMYSKNDEIIIVPGKLLGTGDIDHKLTVVAFDFSKSAVEKIKKANGTIMSVQELLKTNPKAKDVRILG